jgi:hypothetical protein
MTDRQEAKFSMYRKVLNVCDEHEQEYAGIPAFVNAVNELKQQVTDIQSVRQQQTEADSKGTTKDKGSAIDRLAELSLKVANPVYVYAFNTQNNDLRQKVSVNKNTFYNTHDRTALTVAKIIAAEAKTRNEALREYGISDTDITELEAAIVQLEELIDAPSGVIGERKMHTENIRTLFVRADSVIYDKLDKLIRLFKTSSPEFFALYGNARNIVNTAARKRKDKTADEKSGNE